MGWTIDYQYLEDRYGEPLAQRLMREIEKFEANPQPRAVTQWAVRAFLPLRDGGDAMRERIEIRGTPEITRVPAAPQPSSPAIREPYAECNPCSCTASLSEVETDALCRLLRYVAANENVPADAYDQGLRNRFGVEALRDLPHREFARAVSLLVELTEDAISDQE
jgi:hypothetical protein